MERKIINIGDELVSHFKLAKNYNAVTLKLTWDKACKAEQKIHARIGVFLSESFRMLRLRNEFERQSFAGVKKGVHPYDIYNKFLYPNLKPQS